jgi:glycosyltransferase involved in cell wall biosynthesis
VEIILVDDGSKDGTLKFIKAMTEKYPEEESAKTCFVRGLRQMVN